MCGDFWYNKRHGEDKAHTLRRGGLRTDQEEERLVLEQTAYAVFLRPRRFGKSLLVSLLRAYYDVQFADRFEEFFSGTDIGADPTDERGKYLVGHEREAGGGFYDIALKPRLDRWPDIAHAALIEMKYVKAGDPAPTKEQLESVKCKVKSVKLEGDSTLHSTFYTLHSSVTLHRLVLVFHGGECVLSEEV